MTDLILQLIGSYAFPIVACIVLFLYTKDVTEKSREDTIQLNKLHTEEMLIFKDEIKTALNNNTIALEKLCSKLDKKGGIEE